MAVDIRGFGFGGSPTDEARGFTSLLQQGMQAQQQRMALEELQRQQQAKQQIGSLLGEALQPPTQQQTMLAEQGAEFGEQVDTGLPTQDELIAEARKIDPVMAEQIMSSLGLDTASKREEASRDAAMILNAPLSQRQSLIKERIQKITARGGDPKDSLELLDMSPEEQNQALLSVQLGALSTKERFGVQAQQARQRQATQKAFAPVTIVNPKTGEKRLVSPTVDNLTGKATLNPFDVPIGFEIAAETDQEKRAADLAKDIKKEQEKAHIKKTTSQDISFMEKLGAEGAEVYSNLQQAAQDASRFIPRLKSLKDLASKVRTGTGAEIEMLAKRTLGIESASNMEVLNARLGELAQDILNQQTGTKTDFDFQNAVRQSASLGKTKEANAMLIEALIQRQQEAVDFGNQAKRAFKRDGVKGVLDMRFEQPVEQPAPAAQPAADQQQPQKVFTYNPATGRLE